MCNFAAANQKGIYAKKAPPMTELDKNNDKTKAAYKEGTWSIIVNTSLFGLKFWAGIATGSVALMADAWHTLSDSISSIIVIIAAALTKRKPDRSHPFGHGRWEQIASLLIGVLLAIIAYEFLTDAINKLQDKQPTSFGPIAIAVTIVSIIVKEGMAQYAFQLGRKSGNVSVKADGWHHRTDALSSVVVLAGILFANRFWWIDGALGIAISILLFHATYEITKETIAKILGETPSQELIDEITLKAKGICQYELQPHHFHIHNYVTHQELTFHIRLDGALSISEGHAIATQLEEIIRNDYGIEATIHVEPLDYKHTSD